MGQASQRERIIQYALDTYGTEAEYPWADIDGTVLRHFASKKWYALIMSVLPSRLSLPGEETVDVMNVKCSDMMIGSLLAAKGFLPACLPYE